MKKIIITAANGFIGKALVEHFQEQHYEVVALVRTIPAEPNGINYQLWDGAHLGKWTVELEGALAVINLAGRSVNCRYNEKNKRDIYASRLDSTEVIGKAIEQCADKPKVWINAASATIYQHSLDVPMTEKNGVIGEGFSVDVCQRWEKKFNDYRQENVRQIILRTAIVLGENGGVMKPFNRLSEFGLGGKMAAGNQMFSWIHEKDLCRAVEFLIENERCEGIYNLSAPHPVTNQRFMQALRKAKKIPFGIPSPAWLLKIGAWLIGTETELIFKSRFVVPERLLEAGFQFEFPTIYKCLDDLENREDVLTGVENKWAGTAILGSFIFALSMALIVLVENRLVIAAIYALLVVFVINSVISLICSLPVWWFASYISNRSNFKNKRAQVRNFQVALYIVAMLIFAAFTTRGFHNSTWLFLIYTVMLTIYLFTGFWIWNRKFKN